jgi:hypothetical protein
MGDKLVKLYDFIKANGGTPERMRIAMITGVTSMSAASAPDSPENIEKFKSAIKEVLGKNAPTV